MISVDKQRENGTLILKQVDTVCRDSGPNVFLTIHEQGLYMHVRPTAVGDPLER